MEEQNDNVISIAISQAPALSPPALSSSGLAVTKLWLKVSGMSYSVPAPKKKDKPVTILNNINFEFAPGELTAIMGPSGSGKSSLVNVCTASVRGTVEGAVTYNECPVSLKLVRKYVTVVPQEDVLLETCTALEALHYVAELRLPYSSSAVDKLARIQMVMKVMSLEGCADVVIGDGGLDRGLSGGQRKRVSIAQELLVNPSVFFLDEPTSGLDSKVAADVVGVLQQLAQQGRTVICTIHQPSRAVFVKFHNCVLLGGRGHVLYGASVGAMDGYFTDVGYASPEQENPIDFYMREIQVDEQLERFISEWRARQSKYQAAPGLESHTAFPHEDGNSRGVPGWYQLHVLHKRAWVVFMKSKETLAMTCGSKVFMGVAMGVLFSGQGNQGNAGIMPVHSVIFFAIMMQFMDTIMTTIMTFPSVRALFVHEYRNNYYSLTAFYAANLLHMVLTQCFNVLLYLLIMYWLIAMRNTAKAFLITFGVLCLLAMSGACIGLTLGVLIKKTSDAQALVLPIMLCNVFFSGFFTPYDAIQSYFKWIWHVSIFKYAISSLAIAQFADRAFGDCEVDLATFTVTNTHAMDAECVCPVPVNPAQMCYPNGNDYLRKYTIEESDLRKDFIVLGAYTLGFFVCGYGILVYLTPRFTKQ